MASNNNSSSSPFAASLAGLQALANRANASSQRQQSPSSAAYRSNDTNNNNHRHFERGGGGRRGGGGGGRRKRHWEGGGGGGRDHRRPRNLEENDNHYQVTSRLRQSGYQIALFRPPPPPVEPEPPRPFHLALLVLSIDDLAYEHIWKAWASQQSSSRMLVSLLCHAKFPDKVQSDFLKARLLLKPPKYMKGRGNNILELQPPDFLTHRPEWGSIEITRAMIDLLREGLRIDGSSSAGKAGEAAYSTRRYLIQPNDSHSDSINHTNLETIPPVDKFVFISETCLPVTTLEETRLALFGDDPTPNQVNENLEAAPSNTENVSTNTSQEPTESPAQNTTEASAVPTKSITNNLLHMSWVNARNTKTPGTPKNMYERDQFQGIQSLIPDRFRYKADQWLVLSRSHARVVVDLDRQLRPPDKPFWTLFSRINASDEMYFPTALAVLGILHDEEAQPLSSSGTSSAQPTLTTTNNTSLFCQVKRAPVTYTDWSEGMRNPALFTKGVVDFQRVARIAREKGCLFARKFAPFLPVPVVAGIRNNDEPDNSNIAPTGSLSVEEWDNTILPK